MTVYSIMYDGKCEEAYSISAFRKLLKGELAQASIVEMGYVSTLKENENSRRHGWVTQKIKGFPIYGFDIHWEAIEKMHDGAYGN